MDENTPWQKHLLVGVGLLVFVGLLVGGLIAVAALKAADVAGVGDEQTESTEPPPGLIPSTPTTSSPSERPPKTAAPTATSKSPTKTRRPSQPQPEIRLVASPQQAGIYEQVNLTGTYPGAPPGASLQVQRLEGSAWVDFPTSASVTAGTFATYIETGRAGPNRFRVVDSTGQASNVVVVLIS